MRSRFWLTRANLFLLLILFGLGILAGRFWHDVQQIEQQSVQSWMVLPDADCAVVLTGGRGRIRAALHLLRKGQIRHLIISGVHPDAELVDLVTWQDEMMYQPSEQITLERQSQTTFGNAQHSWPLLEALRCESFYLMTSQVHMYRALKTFEGQRTFGALLIPRSTPAPGSERTPFAIIVEGVKTLFYSLWAF